ncbi:MAG: Peptidase autoproteolytic cleavage domain, partial [Candidatus Parcubacteria bacterium]
DLSIGTSSASSRLDVYHATSSSNIDIFRLITDVGSTGNVKFRIDSDGDLFTDGGTTINSGADLAENYSTEDSTITAGMVVTLSTSTTQTWNQELLNSSTREYALATIRKANLGDEALGVISTNPGIILGGNTINGLPVAFSGRVPVYVVGEVKRGDYLTISTSTPGYAMAQVTNGSSIGRALSSSSPNATSSLVMMIVENKEREVTLSGVEGLAYIDSYTATFSSPKEAIRSQLLSGYKVVKEYVAVSVRGMVGYFDELYAKMMKTDTLCVGNTCVTESQLQQMLQQSGTQSAPAPVPPPSGDGQVAGTSTDEGTGSTEGDSSGSGDANSNSSSTDPDGDTQGSGGDT